MKLSFYPPPEKDAKDRAYNHPAEIEHPFKRTIRNKRHQQQYE